MKKSVLMILLYIGVFALICTLLSAPVFLLWNELMPAIFGLPTISFWQAFGLMLLCRLLFGDLGYSHKRKDKDPM